MSDKTENRQSQPGAVPAPPANIREYLDNLHAELDPREVDGQAINCLNGLSTAVGSLYEEHTGMVEELLGVYEQLGMVFEVTRSLPSTETEWEVLELFLGNLQRSFPFCTIGLYCLGPDDYMHAHGSDMCMIKDLSALIDEGIANQGVVVRAYDGDVAEAMVSPILSGDHLIGAIVMTRGRSNPEFRASDMSVVGSLSTFCGDLVRNQRLMEELRALSGTIVQSLVNAIDQKDEYTAGHSTRVAFYADMLGQSLKLSPRDQRMLQWSALLHDVGKIGIRDDVLKKRGPLTTEEFAHMKEHPTRSHEVVCEVPQLAGALDGVRYHHERFDGNGYPIGLAGEDIPLQARIVQIGDVFDALTSTRSYRGAFNWQKALTIMKEEAGSTLDPTLQAIFDSLIRDRLEFGTDTWESLTQLASQFTTGWQPDNQPFEE
ncbi:MAG: HD-GYP domain-containing protein [Planctomycetota bacterium]|jgi:response regulator RpfG family c-di-GMP phosphodiesterase